MKVRKAVIPVAGFGTRFLPVTKSVPKAMLPVVDKPIIQYIVETAVASGIEQIILVTSANCKAVEDYFDRNAELEMALERTGKTRLLELVRGVSDLAQVAYVRQKEPLGNGHAVLMAKNLIGDEPFLVLWGDDILLGEPPIARQLIDVAERFNAPVVGVRPVPEDDYEKYGMLEVERLDARLSRALSVVEKPRRQESPSNLAQIGGFVLTPDIFGLLENTTHGTGGEIYLADALVRLMRQRDVYAYEFEGIRYDAGNKLDFLRATVELALQNPELGPAFANYLKSVRVPSEAASG